VSLSCARVPSIFMGSARPFFAGPHMFGHHGNGIVEPQAILRIALDSALAAASSITP